MSEYQYYEFQAIDRPLTEEEQEAVASLSSRVQPHPRRAVFVYHYGGFRGNAEAVLAQYYDAMFYYANWGSRHLLFRFPAALVDAAAMAQYSVATDGDFPSDAMTVEPSGEHVVVGIRFDEEGGFGWIDGEGWLDRLIGLREALLQGDYRALYLAWLKGITLAYDVDPKALEPPVPPGLGALTPPLQAFVELFDVDATLLAQAAERSPALEPVNISQARKRLAVQSMPEEEKDAFLLRLLDDEPRLSLALHQHLGLHAGPPSADAGARRTVGEVLGAINE
ncbi:MAG TPA: hypothetical protein PKZ84_19185 [Anaerolineae bacterium]|nr:hypothetical protein [Anaerolineae bacterium]HQI87010.1 hypothetical protein [Anaerolineae bacterium]